MFLQNWYYLGIISTDSARLASIILNIYPVLYESEQTTKDVCSFYRQA